MKKEYFKHPTYWGPHAWKFLHSITESYPIHPTEEYKSKTKIFFTILGDMLPCPSCRLNYKNHLIKLPLTDKILNSKDKLSNWLIDIHNEVNKLKNKKVYSYKEARLTELNKISYTNFVLILCIILIFILTIIFNYKIKN